MVTLSGPLATASCELRQARKGATVAADSCAGVWLDWVTTIVKNENVAPGTARSESIGEVSERSKAFVGHFSDAKRELREANATGQGCPGRCC